LHWVEDDTNADESLDRNYLRRRVVPLLRARWPGIATAVGRSARHAAQAQRLLDELARRDVERAADGDRLAASALRGLTLERRRNALRFWISRAGFPAPDTRRLDEICGPLLQARADANPSVTWANVVLRRERGRLSLAAADRASVGEGARGAAGAVSRAGLRDGLHGVPRGEVIGALAWNWTEQPTCELPNGGQLELREHSHGPVDLDALATSLIVRTRVGGERLKPRTGGPTRALKSLLQEAHVPLGERACLPLLFSREQLVAVGDLWVDESVQAGPQARRRGRLVWRRRGQG
jgi:tRNA(Ile)-lysidine synthase